MRYKRSVMVGLALCGLCFQLCGCPTVVIPGPPTGDGSGNATTDGAGSSEPPAGTQLNSCGVRTVNSVPGPGFLEVVTTVTGSATPNDSGLARVLGWLVMCPNLRDPSVLGVRHLYEVGRDGQILASYILRETDGRKCFSRTEYTFVTATFIVSDGCLRQQVSVVNPLDPTQTETLLPPGLSSAGEFPVGPCGEGQVQIGRSGTASDPQGDYICVSYSTEQQRCECAFRNGVWSAESGGTAVYQARGSVDGVVNDFAAFACGAPELAELVDIREGDRLRLTTNIHGEFRTSPGPQELGYEDCEGQ